MKLRLFLISTLLALTTACGFHFPNQGQLSSTVSRMNVNGDYHGRFYKMVVAKLKIRGVLVNEMSCNNRGNFKNFEDVPTLTIVEPSVSTPINSIDAHGAALEYSMIVKANASLQLPNYSRRIIMSNTITRSTLNKADNTLASTNEQNIIKNECYDELSDQLIARINYLGKQTDPNSPDLTVAELLLSEGENNSDIVIEKGSNLTLYEALTEQDNRERENANSVTLNELNNGSKILDPNKNYRLPRTRVNLPHQAPELSELDGDSL